VMRPAIAGNYAIAVSPWITFLALTM